MTQTPRKVNYTKWGVIISALIGIPSAIATLTTFPEIGCKVGLKTPACNIPQKDAEFIVRAETGEPLSGVTVEAIANKGAPEVQSTDDRGYVKVSIPSKGDVRIILSKKGYPGQDFHLNLENNQDTMRTITFSQSGQPSVQAVASLPTSSSPSASPSSSVSPINDSPTNTRAIKVVTVQGFTFELQQCKRVSETIKCEFNVINKEKNRVLRLFARGSYSSRIIDTQGDQSYANLVNFGGVQDVQFVPQSLIQGIRLKAYIIFDTLPPQANQLNLVELSASSLGVDFQVPFSNIPISN